MVLVQICEHLTLDSTNSTGYGCKSPGNCRNLYNDVYCPIKHYLYNCNYIGMEFSDEQIDPISFHCCHPDAGNVDFVCPVKGDRSVKCPLRAKIK